MAYEKRHGNEPIAIVGSGCRFPGEVNTPSKLWQLLKEPRDLLSQIPETRFNPDGFFHPDNAHHGTSNIRHSYLLSEDHRHFDTQFFGIKPVEAHSIDPQQRLLLEVVYESIEAAGLSIEALQGSSTAVYVGLMCGDYADLLGRDTSYFPTYFATGTARSIISNRISYCFDWRGPSMTIDTACSSSLVAVHQAVQILRSGESRVAVAAGANLLLGPEQYIAESNLKMLSPDGRSYMWDERANGYARGEGIASIVLKTLSTALEDGDDIECIIKETGLNQDGKTKGITMPSASAQAALIAATYAKAGLNASDPRDRPQYFEAHGTGTPAGDPIEAEAISTAFFADQQTKATSKDSPLFVGSIKTVIGHTEGTAGLAGLLKAALALKHGVIPPNRLFGKLASAVAPFYENLEIATKARLWPSTDPDAPRRASVNSFGFGGANAHCILETFSPSVKKQLLDCHAYTQVYTPFTFSATSERSLVAMVASYSAFLKEQKSVNLRALSCTLNSRRSAFSVRASFSAADLPRLCSKLDLFVEGKGQNAVIPMPLDPGPLHVLGIFTGQGAQWAQMGAELLSSPAAMRIVDNLEQSLFDLPFSRPDWSLKAELLANKKLSRVGEAALSQPLCTALQIVLIELLRAAKIRFAAVVGHSSGEIGAAYAAGYLSARDAIRIAYYRGIHLHLAQGKKGQIGAMIAVGTSFEDAQELCKLKKFRGRIYVAASNSATSITLSGDADAIEDAKIIFEEEQKFVRMLKVDKAYHSHHMTACSDAYMASLRACQIRARHPVNRECLWVSSVYQQDINDVQDDLNDLYWVKNLISPVLFSQAVTYALGETKFDLAMELGPHPALKGPVSQVLQDVSGETIPYTGLLSRGFSDIEALADGLGYVWTSVDKPAINYVEFDKTLNEAESPNLLKGLPPYSWEHERVYWHESRVSKSFREQQHQPHELLGIRRHNFSDEQVRWSNYLIPKELPWIAGHRIQGQMVFPAAAYMSAAFEAARNLAAKEPIRLIELEDFSIGQAIVFDDESSSVETLISLTDVQRHEAIWTAEFAYFSTGSRDPGPLSLNAKGRIRMTFGTQDQEILPAMPSPHFGMVEVESEQFYNTFAGYGYGYTGPFKALTSMRRKVGVASGLVQVPEIADSTNEIMIHPVTLDAAVQSILLAFCFPGDGRLRSIQLPTNISHVTINPSLCAANSFSIHSLKFVSTISNDDGAKVEGDVDLYPMDGQYAMLQLEGMHTTPMVPQTESTDFNIFSEAVWESASPDAMALSADVEEDFVFGFILERVAYFYMRHVQTETSIEDRERCEWYHKHLFSYLDTMLHRIDEGIHPFARREWINDSYDEIISIIESYPDSIDLRLMRAVGENIIAVIRGKTTMLEPMLEDNMLNDFYVLGLGMPEYLKRLTSTAKQIGHRYPAMSILEIGAGTGGATKSILRELDQAFASYTFTDISSGFFENARDRFKAHEAKMAFKTLDIEKDVVEQGFAKHSFDLVIASLVLHATSKLEETVANVRRLLKPGGYLLMLEITDNDVMRFGFIFGGLPGWWLGVGDGRPLSPCIEPRRWEMLLKDHGFSGIDSISPHKTDEPLPLCVLLSQAIDERVDFLRHPLSSEHENAQIQELTIIGGSTPRTSGCAASLMKLLHPHCDKIVHVESLTDLSPTHLSFSGSVVCMQDLDEPAFMSMSATKLQGLQTLFEKSKNVLWVTCGYKACEPHAKMMVGFAKSLTLEMQHLRLQFLDISHSEQLSAHMVSAQILRFTIADTWEEQGRLKDIFWSLEPELAYESGREFVPRIQLNKSLNNRYNSSRRLITENVDPKSQSVSLSYASNGYILKASSGLIPIQATDSSENVDIQILYSISKSLKIGSLGYLFLVLGTEITTGARVVALSTVLSSQISVSRAWTRPCLSPAERSVEYLVTMFYTLLANSALSGLSRGDSVVVLAPSKPFAATLTAFASKKGIQHKFLTPNRTESNQKICISIHPRASKRDIAAIIPRNVTRVLTLETDSWCTTIQKLFPHTMIETSHTLLHVDTSLSAAATDPQILDALEVSQKQVLSKSSENESCDVPILSLHEILRPSAEETLTCILDWRISSTVPVQIEPVDSRQLFKSDKTYWLVGLTGGLGLSLCRWMLSHGARFLVISSRNPKVDRHWISDLEASGATLKVYANDVTNRDSLRSVYDRIQNELPPVAGVCQGAMILHDTMFLGLDMPRMEKVLKPKVSGALLLDEIFFHHHLDFFVFLSSMASVTGNPGQSAYGAANMFLAGLAAQRRQRGVAASTVHIGAIIGNGYVTRELNLSQQIALQKVGNMWMSEQDFHQIFAEAVVASPPQPGPSPEYLTGLRTFYADEENQPQYATNPIFSHLAMHRNLAGPIAGSNTAAVSVKSQLLRATTKEEIHEIISASLVSKLEAVLQTPPDLDIISQGADTLGIDSLVAVDLRSWFMKTLNVDMPVLKIISGATIGEILDRAQELLNPQMIPNLGTELAIVDKPVIVSPDTASQPAKAISETKHMPSNQFIMSSEPKSRSETPTPQLPETTPARPIPEPKTSPGAQLSAIALEESVARDKAEPIDSGSRRGIMQIKHERSSDDLEVRIAGSPTSNSIQSLASTSFESEALSDPKGSTSESSKSSFEDIFQPSSGDSSIQRVLPMSFSQTRFWFLKFYLEDQNSFNVTTSIRLRGRLRINDLAQAVATVGQRHETLRTRFFTDRNHLPMQAVLEWTTLRLERKEVTDADQISDEYTRLKNHIFDLGSGETMRIILLSLSPDLHHILLGYHHINMDGLSFEVFFSDLEKAYNAKLSANNLPLQYPDFAARQRREYLDGKWDSELRYWREEFSSNPSPLPLLPLSTLTSRPALRKYRSYLASHRVSPHVSARISETCRKMKVSSFHFYLTVYRTLIARYVEIDDLCIGVADANRNDSDVQQSLGCYLNLLPLRFNNPTAINFSEALKETKVKAQRAFANSRVPFDVLLNELSVPRSSSESPLFQTFFNYRQGIAEKRTFCDCDCEWVDFDGGQTAYDLSLDIVDNAGGNALLRLFIQQDFYSSSDAEILMKSFVNLLDAFSENPAARISKPSLHSKEGVEQAISIGRGSLSPSKWQGTLVDRIDEVARAHARDVALRDGNLRTMTYSQMINRANTIATSMSGLHVKQGSKVAVFQDPTSDWVCSLLAVLRLGGIYVPLDPRLTTMRLAAIVSDCQPAVILTDDTNNKSFQLLKSQSKKVNISELSHTLQSKAITNSSREDSIMAILYTSGTSGTPKGIVMKHATFREHVETVSNAWISKLVGKNTLQQSSLGFDMSLAQIFWPLCSGGSVYVVPQSARGDPVALSQIISSEKISITAATPSEYISWLRYGSLDSLRSSSWSFGVSGGEKVTHSLMQTFKELDKQGLRLMDCYGPTEVTFFCHFSELSFADYDEWDQRHSRLFPWFNFSTYIVDSEIEPVPVGVPGEVVIGGMGIASSYLNMQELTDRRFLPDKFSSENLKARGWHTMHLTGDRGRLHPDGTLLLEGRIVGDTQIKLRGLRIDLQDIEATLIQASHGQVLHAIVSVRNLQPSDTEFLVGHVELTPGRFSTDTEAFIRKLLVEIPLPQYMRPAFIVPVEKLPRTTSGKVDRLSVNALPLSQTDQRSNSPRAISQTESRLLQLWEEVLTKKITDHFIIGPESDFFEVGGSSLLLVGLQALIKKTFSVDLPLNQLFDGSRFGRMATKIHAHQRLIETSPAPHLTAESSDEKNPVPPTVSELIDWEREVSTPPSLTPYVVLGINKPRTVVLTGSTGFLGKALLRRLVSARSIGKIHCVAIRPGSSHFDSSFSSPKVQVHIGDQSLPFLGLKSSDAATVFSEADAIIHNGSDVSFLKTYNSLRRVNVESTKVLANWAVTYGLQFHYVSTASVAYLSGQESYPSVSVRSFEPPADGSNGYIASKWASEVYLEGMNERFDMPVVIHRPSSITGPGVPGTDVMGSLLKFSKMMHAVPKSEYIKGHFDFVSVDNVAKGIVNSVQRGVEDMEIRYVFESGDVQIESSRMKENLERQTGEMFVELTIQEWTRRAEVLGLNTMVAAFLKGTDGQGLLMTKLIRS